MRRFPAMSIKTKLFLAITLVPVFALSFFLAQSLKIFEDDKIAYVFESSLSFSRTKALQVTSELRAFQSILKGLAFNVRRDRTSLTSNGQLQFEDDPRLFGFELWSADGTGSRLLFEHRKTGAPTMPPPGSDSFTAAESAVAIATARSANGPLYISLSMPLKNDGPPLMVRLTVLATALQKSFEESEAHASFLTKSDGALLLAPSGYDPSKNDFKISEAYARIGAQESSSGTLETGGGPGGEKYLTSYARLGIGGLVVITTVEKKQAVSAAETLMIRAAWLFLGLLASTLVLSAFSTRQLTRALDRLFEATRRVGQGDFGVKVEVTSRDEIGELAQSFNTMSEEVARLISELTLKARMEAELQTAKAVQATLFPAPQVRLGPLDIAGSYEPASECGGDWWYHSENDRHVNVFIGDVTGHGAPAALMTSAAHAACVVAGHQADLSPAQYLDIINRAVYSAAKGQLMMTFFVARLEKATGLLTYAIASHEAPLLLPGTVKEVGRNSYVLLDEMNNPRLGQSMESKFREATVQLSPGDRIFLYTDGVYDLESPAHQDLGQRRMGKMLAKSFMENSDSEGALGSLMRDLNEWRGGQGLKDDVTAVILTYSPTAVSRSAA